MQKGIHIRPTVIMNRAVPGSGKTSLTKGIVEALRDAGVSCRVHSTDERFIVRNRYVFDISRLGEYHQATIDSFTDDLRNGVEAVICDNTNLLPWQTEPYTVAAREYCYRVVFVNLLPRELTKHLDAQRITPEKPDAHNVPEEVLSRFIDDFKTYNSLLDKNEPIDPERHYVYRWDDELYQRIRIDEPIKHFDTDYIITIKPDEYHEIKQSIGKLILEQIVN